MSLRRRLLEYAAALISLVLAAAGVWLDGRPVLEQGALFAAFQLASLAGVVWAVAALYPHVSGTALRLLLILGAAVVWRVSYFPIMVFAGWVATLGEWAALAAGLPVVIYPTFLLAMAAMHSAAVLAGGWMVLRRRWRWAPVLIPALAIAVMVSFTAREDLTWLPDHSITIAQPVPALRPPLRNPYFEALASRDYNVAEQVLVFASGAMYALIPRTPWSTAVKSVLEHAFRAQPEASSAERVREHYLAFRAAQPLIREGAGSTNTVRATE